MPATFCRAFWEFYRRNETRIIQAERDYIIQQLYIFSKIFSNQIFLIIYQYYTGWTWEMHATSDICFKFSNFVSFFQNTVHKSQVFAYTIQKIAFSNRNHVCNARFIHYFFYIIHFLLLSLRRALLGHGNGDVLAH